MSDILYTIIIFPIVQVIELCYLFVSRVFHNPGIAILGVSAAVSVLTLPLYFRAEKWQETERELQKRLAPKIAKIKAVFSGDERYMLLQAYYRQNNYHPVYALRGSFGLLIQIPFFIAAYSFIAHLEVLHGVRFLFIADLGKPDALLRFNVLPVIMTLINCISGAVYTKGFPLKDKIQLYGMAAIFLVLLYNSPAALVLYWTTNNIFSLVKNIVYKAKNPGKIVYIALCVCAVLFDVFLLAVHSGYLLKRVIIAAIAATVFFIPLLRKGIIFLKNKINYTALAESSIAQRKTFITASASIFLLAGLVIPSSLIASSTGEFSFLEQYASPAPFIGATLLQSLGVFLFWPLCLFFLFSPAVKKLFAACAVFLCAASLINVFLFPGNYGFLTNTLIFSNPGTWSSDYIMIFLNIIALAVLPVLLFFLVLPRFKTLFFSVQVIAVAALCAMGAFNIITINREYHKLLAQESGKSPSQTLTPIFNVSKTGKNVVIIMLDRAISGFVPYIFAEKPELHDVWSGFTWYPNCVSFAGWTLYGVPALAGGYEYTPFAMQQNPSKPLVEKHNEALLLLPRLFASAGYTSVVTDPPYANYGFSPDLRIFDSYPTIYAENIRMKYTDFWMKNHQDIQIISVSGLLQERLLRFSFFKTAPAILRLFIYDRGDWLTVNNRDIQEGKNELTVGMIGKYAALDYLPKITNIDSGAAGAFNFVFNELTHDPVFLQVPAYVPAAPVSNRGSVRFAEEAHYHVNMAAVLLLGKWFDYLKENNVYDNTRIIIVSDHGGGIDTGPDGFTLPDGNRLEKYTSLLMVKDFNATGALVTDSGFMTQADVPHLALDGIIDNPLNPFSGKPIQSERENGALITTSNRFYPVNHGKYHFRIDRDEWLFVHDNIFKRENWERVEK